MIGIYSAPHEALTPAVQDAMRDTWQAMCISEGWLDSKAIPTPHDGGVWQQDNEMTFVAYVADEGSVVYSNRGPIIRKLADQFGYQKATNFKAAVLECTKSGLLTARVENGDQVISMTDYGWETLARYEHQRDLDIEIGIIEPDALPTQDEIEMAAMLWGCDLADAENRIISGDIALIGSAEEKWEKGTLFFD